MNTANLKIQRGDDESGCILTIPSAYTRIYPYVDPKNNALSNVKGTPNEYDLLATLVWLCRGIIQLDDLTATSMVCRFVGADWTVDNPVQDKAMFN